jgi:PAS domain S-box-containing protein
MPDANPNPESVLDKLREREARMRAIVDTIFDGVLVSQDGIIVEVTDTVLQWSGYEKNEMIGRPVLDFVAEDYRDVVQRRESTGNEGRFDAVAVSKSGERRIVEVITAQHVSRGQRVKLVAIRDVTAIRRLELQVRQMQQMEALGRFAWTVAHEVNNLLQQARLLGYVLMEELDKRQRMRLGEILKAIDLGTALARPLLSFGRMGSDLPAVIDVNTVVRDAEVLLRRLIGSDVELVVELADDAGAVRADATQLELVILNLAINAREAMPDGGTIVVRTRTVELRGPVRPGPGVYTLLEISDSGTGIPVALRGRIFEPLFTTKADRHGTGLGLAIVRQIVEHSGGFVHLESAEGGGSTFAIYLPHADSNV